MCIRMKGQDIGDSETEYTRVSVLQLKHEISDDDEKDKRGMLVLSRHVGLINMRQ